MYQIEACSSILYFHLNITGSSLIACMPWYILSISSCLDPTRICLRKERAILLKNISIMFNHDPCLGVNTNSKRPGFCNNHALVSFETCEEWLSSTIRIVQSSGYCLSSSPRNSINSLLLCLSLTNSITLPVCRYPLY